MFQISFAAGIYIRNSGHFSEFIIAGMANSVLSVSEGESKLMIELLTPLSADSASRFDDPFIKALSVEGRMLTITFFPDTDYTMGTSDKDILITAARKKKTEDIQIGYGIEEPVVKDTGTIMDDKNAEEVLEMIDDAMENDELDYALSLVEQFLNSGVAGYYRQEGLFRLGMVYMKLGEYEQDNYVFAGKIFDDFIKEYPDSFRKKDVLIKAAEAKEYAMLYNEAVFAYNNVIKSLRDKDIRRMAYERIADIYASSGQYRKAIDAHENVIKNFKDSYAQQKAKIGLLHSNKKDFDLAYKSFLQVMDHKDKLGLLEADELYAMGKIFDSRSKYTMAREAFEKVYALHPSSKLADLAMYESARMYEKEGNGPATDARLEICKQVYKEKNGGLLCLVMHAGRHLETKVPEEWEKVLEPAINSREIDIRAEAELVLIRAYFKQNKYDKADERVSNFLKKSFTSEHLPEVYVIRQQITLTKAKDAFKKSEYEKARNLILDMLDVFPDTVYKKEAQEILQDIRFGDIKDMYYEGRYKDTVDALNKFLVENEDLINPVKWIDMLQEAKFAYGKELYTEDRLLETILTFAEYRAQFPDGAHITEVDDMLSDSISRTLDENYQNKEFIKIISLNEQNSDFVNSGGTVEFRDKVKSLTAFSLYKMGVHDQAEKMLEDVSNRMNPYYLMTSIMLELTTEQVDPNIFTDDMFDFLVQELEAKKPDYIIEMLKNYTKDKKYAMKKIYSISKGVFDDLKREAILFDLNERLDKDEESRFDGYPEVYLDTGISYYKRNNFENAVTALEKFKLKHMPRDEKRAEGLYYLGKSYMKLDNKEEQSMNALMELLESIPDSVYASAARSELEEIEWRKNLKK